MNAKNQFKRLSSSLLALLMILSVVFSVPVVSSAASVVPSGAKEYKGHTYYVYKSSANWKKAKELCENRGGHLVTITSEGENKLVASLFEKSGLDRVWLGATDEAKEGTWKWVTGESFTYENWYSGQPNNYNSEQHWLTFENYSGEWNDWELNENDVYGYVCEWDMSKAAASSPRFAKSSCNVYYGYTTTLKVLNYSGTVKWSSSNTKIATVSSKGVVKGVALGSAYIYAKYGSKTLKCKVTVIDRSINAKVSFKIDGGYFINGISSATAAFRSPSYACGLVKTYIVGADGKVVFSKSFTNVKKNTSYSYKWYGKDKNGKYVPSGSYRMLVKIGTSGRAYSSYIAVIAKNDFSGGNGSASNPFLVASTSQLRKIIKYPNAYFKQTKDLDFDYTSVGNFFTDQIPFNGVYDGAGKTISNISANAPLFNYVGAKGQIKNLKTKGCSIVGDRAAILVNYNYGKITNCQIKGTASSNVYGDTYVAMIAAENFGTITNCTASGSISGRSSEYYSYVGGISSINRESGKIINCTATVNVNGYADEDYCAGGLVGINKGMLNNCEASGKIDGNGYYNYDRTTHKGGIAGKNESQIINCYYTGSSTVNIAGYNSGVIA